MSSLLESIPVSKFKLLKTDQIRDLKSIELTADGEYLCTVIIPPRGAGVTIYDVAKTNAEYLGHRGNTVGGKTLAEVLGEDSCQSTPISVESVEDDLINSSNHIMKEKQEHVPAAVE